MSLDLIADKSTLVKVMAGAISHQTITLANAGPDLCPHMVSTVDNELRCHYGYWYMRFVFFCNDLLLTSIYKVVRQDHASNLNLMFWYSCLSIHLYQMLSID